ARRVHRAHGVDHPAGAEVTAGGGGRLPGGQAVAVAGGSQFAALGEDGGAAAAVNRPIHAAAAEQGRVGGIDDGGGLLAGDVAELQRDPHNSVTFRIVVPFQGVWHSRGHRRLPQVFTLRHNPCHLLTPY